MSENQESLNWDDVIKIASGKDELGLPVSSASISVDEIEADEETLKTLQNIYLEGAILNIHASGGCVIITADFPQIARGSCKEVIELCNKWLENLENPDFDNQMLYLTLVPHLLEGSVFVIFNQLVYVDSYMTDVAGVQRVIFCFDNTATMPVESEDINYRAIIAEMEAELQRRDDQLENEIQELLEQKAELEKENIYGDQLREDMNSIDNILAKSKQKENSMIAGKSNVRNDNPQSSIRFTEGNEHD